MDKVIGGLQQAVNSSDYIDRLHPQELVDIENALQYGVIFSLLLRSQYRDASSCVENHDQLEDMIPRIRKIIDVVTQAVQKLNALALEFASSVCKISDCLLRASTDFDFDADLRSTRAYEANRIYSESADLECSSDKVDAATSAAVTRSTDIRSLLQTIQSSHYPSIGSTWAVDAEAQAEDVYLASVSPTLCVYDDSDTMIRVNCLLDTGATYDCISREQRKAMSLGSRTREIPQRVIKLGDNSEVKVTRVVKFQWRFEGKEPVYESQFFEVPSLSEHIIIGRNTIFERDLLLSNPDLPMVGQNREGRECPRLTVLGFLRQSKSNVIALSLSKFVSSKLTAKQTTVKRRNMTKSNTQTPIGSHEKKRISK